MPHDRKVMKMNPGFSPRNIQRSITAEQREAARKIDSDDLMLSLAYSRKGLKELADTPEELKKMEEGWGNVNKLGTLIEDGGSYDMSVDDMFSAGKEVGKMESKGFTSYDATPESDIMVLVHSKIKLPKATKAGDTI